ncbi:GNAT family N-acetyltransferase [Fusobacterium sp.]|uniref:GNAT family N-acetyltransferase n=1 Tax=Fusobacterium sp. TaxID=68766 RepID=UPI002903AFE0|nr:GNAT family N-acetyltransferase [Fusobacterium sp.]MDU1912186.1 GNAT family N-acetyltransferase [Fusobacterium sp.]
MEEIFVVEFEERHLKGFKKIGYEWLLKYDLLEPVDEEMLNNPKEKIVDKGGFVYIAEIDNECVGTVSLGKLENGDFEVLKLAVSDGYQGKKIGSLLMEMCFEKAREKGAKKLILYSNHKLKAALHLYKKYGFIELKCDGNKYEEADIKMECVL